MDSNTPQSQVSPPTLPPISEPQPSHNWLKWVLIIIVAVILSSGATYLVLNSQSQNQTPLPAEVSTKDGPTPTIDPTANWKTYTNTKYGYSIMYPNSFIPDRATPIGDLTDEQLQILDHFTLLGIDFQKSNIPGSGIRLNIVFNPDNIKCTTNDECLENMVNHLKISQQDISYIYKTILGKNIKGFEYFNASLKQINQYFVFPNRDNILQIGINITGLTSDEVTSVNKVTDQILSTFKFTDSADETANWKTYKNQVLDYTIKYPDGMVIEEIGERDIMITRTGVPYGGQEGKVPAGGMVIYYRGHEGLEKGNDLLGAPTTKITINGFPAIQAKYNETSPYSNDFFISDLENERVVRVSITTSGDDGYEENTFKIFNQILQTFKFTQ